MHPALHCWREELPGTLLRHMTYLGGAALLSIAAARVFQPPPSMNTLKLPDQSVWIDVERPFQAFTLSIPEAAGVPSSYVIRRHSTGGGRKDILTLGEPNSAAPFLHVEIYRPGSEIGAFADAATTIAGDAAELGPMALRQAAEPLESKFGPIEVFTFVASAGRPRLCLAIVRDIGDPRLRLSGWFCQGDAFVARSTLACALDRLTLLSAGSEPKVGALFAQAELRRSYCGQHDPIVASTPKHTLLWKALANRRDARRSVR
jgi:hypothetical protein